MADDDLWHVRMAEDEVKILSLEKLDDLFRLDVIDGDVLVWQPGMDEWLPLRVVAGIGDDAPEVVEIAVSERPPQPIGMATATAWPPVVAVARQVAPVQTLSAWPPKSLPPPPSSRSMLASPSSRVPASRAPASLAPVSRAPASLAPVSRAPASPVPSANSWPPPAAWQDPAPSAFATTVSAGQYPLYADAAPRAAMDTDIRPRRRGGGTWLVVVALAAGAVVTLYRNAMVHAAAKSMGQEPAYLNLETALGGPSFGTPRAVEKMAESAESLRASVAASTASLAATTAAATSTATSSPSPAPETTAESPAPSKPSSPAAATAAGATKTVSAVAPSPRAPAAKEADPLFKPPKKGKKGNEFDPLNPNL